MLPERELLDSLTPSELSGRPLSVTWKDDKRSFILREQIGRGQTAIAWRAEDSIGDSFAVKFVPKAEYKTHSLDAEACRANSLPGDFFARISFFGESEISSPSIDLSAFYTVVVEWIQGDSLDDYLEDPDVVVDAAVFCQFARDLCTVLQILRTPSPALTHNDLHGKNILIRPSVDALTGAATNRIAIIDTGQLKTTERRDELIETWRQELNTIRSVQEDDTDSMTATIEALHKRIEWFNRTDQEWVVFHLTRLYNKMQQAFTSLNSSEKRFCRALPGLLRQMLDLDHSRRLDDPKQMFREIERLRSPSSISSPPPMTTPFDLPSAELIRSDRQLMDLFSEEYPRIDACRSYAPIYIYGPRGSGKSTILRSLSFKALLASENCAEALEKIPFLGIYISSSQELRSRFWLMGEADFSVLEGHVIRYFNLLLIEALVDTFDSIYGHSTAATGPHPYLPQFSAALAQGCAEAIRKRVGLDTSHAHYAGTSEFALLRHDLQRLRDELWAKILDKSEPRMRSDAQLVFDIVRDLEGIWDYLKARRIVFLVDDYSNQRIPRELQQRLNQAITFSKQGSPIFKVTSEYDGVDLDGVQEGREVNEVNVGFEYVSLTGTKRYRFLLNVLEKRFRYCKSTADLLTILPLSNLGPAIPMATAIRDALRNKERFYYHGLDTISDLCSGDFAMGIDVVRRIFEHAGADWRHPVEITPQRQDEAIREYAKQEFEYLRHQSQNGRRKFDIADRLCWLSKECLLRYEISKEGKTVPLIKNHIDVRENALRELERDFPEESELLRDLISTGVMFPLQSSRAQREHDATRRFMTRRILLARYSAALGRHRPIRIDDVQRLLWLLTEPGAFVDHEVQSRGPLGGDDADPQSAEPYELQLDLFPETEPENSNG